MDIALTKKRKHEMSNDKEKNRKYYERHSEYYKQYRDKHSTSIVAYQKEYKRKARLICLKHYGGNPPECACCGENRIEFLTIDHIAGGGAKHRATERGASNLNLWLRTHKFPKGFRVLCYNCNESLGIYKYCPHRKMGKSRLGSDHSPD